LRGAGGVGQMLAQQGGVEHGDWIEGREMIDRAGRPLNVGWCGASRLEAMRNARLFHDDIGGMPGWHVPGNGLVAQAVGPDFMRPFACP